MVSRSDSYFLLPFTMEQAAHGFDVFNTNHGCECVHCKSYRDAVKRLVNSFSSIPTRWLQHLDDAPTCLPMWGTVFMPTDSVDIRRIDELLRTLEVNDDDCIGLEWQAVGDTGIYAIECDGELILGIDGAGYDFYTDHWSKLYDAIDYHWHTPVDPA